MRTTIRWASKHLFLHAMALAACGLTSQAATAATVNFSGKVFTESPGGPVIDGLVVVGTFAPSFDPFNYTNAYGDSSGNLLPGAYEMAVIDGAFMPIANALTDGDGFFAGAGTVNAPAGTPLWLFAFETPFPDSFFQVLATSAHPAWSVPLGNGNTQLLATQLDLFVMGQTHPEGVSLTVIPFPEPAACSLALGGFLSLAALTRRANSGSLQR